MKLVKYLPHFLRIKLIRSQINIENPPPGFQVIVATEQGELERAYALLHDCYVHAQLMTADVSGLRCNFFSFLPQTTVIVAKLGNEVIGTVSLIKDSSMGLPSDKEFQIENNELRKKGSKLLEVSSLAIDAKFRKKKHFVSLYLMKYLQHYATTNMGCDTVTCVVHPRAGDFYTALWGFKLNKKVVKYEFVNNALGVHMFGNIERDYVETLTTAFPSAETRNPIKFLSGKDNFLIYPQRDGQNHLDPIYTPELLRYFLSQRTSVDKKLSSMELRVIYSAYKTFFDQPGDLTFIKDMLQDDSKIRHFRFPTSIDAKLVLDQKVLATGKIMDLTGNGAFLATEQILEIGQRYQIEFILGESNSFVSMIPRWHNKEHMNHLSIGYGIEFSQTQLHVVRSLKLLHFGERRAKSRTR